MGLLAKMGFVGAGNATPTKGSSFASGGSSANTGDTFNTLVPDFQGDVGGVNEMTAAVRPPPRRRASLPQVGVANAWQEPGVGADADQVHASMTSSSATQASSKDRSVGRFLNLRLAYLPGGERVAPISLSEAGAAPLSDLHPETSGQEEDEDDEPPSPIRRPARRMAAELSRVSRRDSLGPRAYSGLSRRARRQLLMDTQGALPLPPTTPTSPNMVSRQDVFVAAGRRGSAVAWWVDGKVVLGSEGRPMDEESWSDENRPSAVLALVHGPYCQALDALVRGVRDACGPSIAILVVMLGSVDTSTPWVCDHLLALQSHAFAAGADDFVFGTSSPGELGLHLDMCARRHGNKVSAVEKTAQMMMDNMRQEQQISMDKIRDEERAKDLIWMLVDFVFPGFPLPDFALPAEPQTGATVGLCRLEQALGQGSFGAVYRAENLESGDPEAIKVIAKRGITRCRDLSALNKEVSFHSKLRHEHIVALHGVMHGPAHIFIRMELGGACTLFAAMRNCGGKLPVSTARRFQGQLADAVAYCHRNGVAHRDLKPENMVVGEGHDGDCLKIVDFGHAVAADDRRADVAGTFPFMAPEVIIAGKDDPYDPAAADVWSCGVILLEMLCGIRSFDRMMGWTDDTPIQPERCEELAVFFSDRYGLHHVVKTNVPSAAAGGCHDLLESLLLNLLELEPTKRYTSEQMNASLWLRER